MAKLIRGLGRFGARESGFALVMALGITVVLSITVITVVESTASNQRASTLSKNRVSAYALAEAGINNSESILTHLNPYDQHILHPQSPNQPADCASPPQNTGIGNPPTPVTLGNTCSPITVSMDGGSVTFSGYIDSNSTWHITSTGTVRNPYSVNGSVNGNTTRTITATVHVRALPSQYNYVTAWNYVFVKDTTPNVCNITLDQSTNFAVSLYVAGNLCFKNSANIAETNTSDPISLEVLGQVVYLNGSSKGIGDKSLPSNGQVTSAKIGGGCATTSVGNNVHTCTTAAPYNDYFYVKAGGYSTSAPAISAPSLVNSDFTNYYNTAYISRLTTCLASGNGGTTLANTAFDSNTTPLDGTGGNGSLASAFDLTPSSGNYSCQVKDGFGAVTGELDWDSTNKLLKVRGTIYIDGNVTISQNAAYEGVTSTGVHNSGNTDGQGGQAVIYASGELTSNNVHLCGWNTALDQPATTNGTVPVNANCDYSKWTPNTSMLMFVLHGSPTSIDLGGGTNCYFQGAIYAQNGVNLGQQCQTDGPFIAGSMSVGQGVTMRPLPSVQDLPVGAPGNPNTSGVPEAPSYGTG